MNSATSSSESECENLYHNSFRANSYRRAPLYPTLGHPLIYYAEIKPKRRSRRNRENEKNKSNCFVKAFRWYTQEHIPFKNNQSSNGVNDADMNGFATWLDEKYNEYLQTNRIEQNQCLLSQTSTLQIVNTVENFDSKMPASEKFPRSKSPWHKRAKSLIARNKTYIAAKSNQNIKVILKPKTLSRAASAYCQRSDFQTRNNSNSSVKSDTSALRMKLQPTSKSLTSVLKEREIYVIPFDILQDASHNDMKGNVNENKRNDRKKIKQIFPKEDLSSAKTQQKKDVRCRCSYNTLGKNNTLTKGKKLKGKSNLCRCYERKPEVEVSQQIAVISETRTNTKCRMSSAVPGLVSESVQTSDYSVNLGNDNCPLFVKII